MERYISYKNEWGATLPTLSDGLSKPVKIYEGNIFKTEDEHGGTRHYSIESVQNNEMECEVTLREVRPQGYKALLLAAGLAAGWYAIEYIMTFL